MAFLRECNIQKRKEGESFACSKSYRKVEQRNDETFRRKFSGPKMSKIRDSLRNLIKDEECRIIEICKNICKISRFRFA